jgi:hypothetical protein
MEHSFKLRQWHTSLPPRGGQPGLRTLSSPDSSIDM